MVPPANEPPSPPAEPAEPQTAGGDGPEGPNVLVHGTFVRLMIAAAVLLTAGVVSLIYYNWARSRFPSSCIVLGSDGTESLDGVEVVVSDGEQDVKVMLRGKEDSPVLVEPRLYTLTVRYAGNFYRQQVSVPHRRMVRIPVTTRPIREPPPGRWDVPGPYPAPDVPGLPAPPDPSEGTGPAHPNAGRSPR